ncbi:MAG: hypothetical protein WC455_14245 [Dehalococcoidia bacterium]|jgi:hypothetical protein
MDKTGHFYYSKRGSSLSGAPVNKCLLADGRIEQYTEWTHENKPMSVWDDLVYLGEGIIYWHNGVDQVTETEVWQWQLRRKLVWFFKSLAWLAFCAIMFFVTVFFYQYLKGLLP